LRFEIAKCWNWAQSFSCVTMRTITLAVLSQWILAACSGAAGSRNERVKLVPQLHAGQTLTYQIRYQSEKRIKTESAVVSPMAPEGGKLDVQRSLRVEVREVRPDSEKPSIALRMSLASEIATEDDSTESKPVEFVLHRDGGVSDVSGTDALSPEEQDAWRDCISQFAIAFVFPESGVSVGGKWKTQEPVPGGPLAGVFWEKESEYVNNADCPVASANVAQQMCAVILTRAKLKQNSSSKNATPEDFKLHELHTAGTAHGVNEVVSYISLKTGLLVRASEEARQDMDVVVAKADGTNRVHYNVGAQGHLEMLLVAEAERKRP